MVLLTIDVIFQSIKYGIICHIWTKLNLLFQEKKERERERGRETKGQFVYQLEKAFGISCNQDCLKILSHFPQKQRAGFL